MDTFLLQGANTPIEACAHESAQASTADTYTHEYVQAQVAML